MSDVYNRVIDLAPRPPKQICTVYKLWYLSGHRHAKHDIASLVADVDSLVKKADELAKATDKLLTADRCYKLARRDNWRSTQGETQEEAKAETSKKLRDAQAGVYTALEEYQRLSRYYRDGILGEEVPDER